MTCFRFRRCCSLAVLLLASALVSGCGETYGVRTYTVPKQPPPDRLLGAILPRGEKTWFFKLVGKSQAIADVQRQFESLVRSVTFSEAAAPPTWTLPAGWRELPGSGMRYKSIEIPNNGGALQISVTELPTMGSDLDAYILSNVNRWRREMRMPEIGLADLPGSTTSDESPSGRVTRVDLAGRAGGGGSDAGMAPPFAGGGVPAEAPGAPPKPTYQVPPEWKVAAGDQFSAEAFEVTDGERAARITLTPLAGGGGDLLSNVNRWRAQVGLEPIAAEQLETVLQPVEVRGATGFLLELVAPESATAREAILGAFLETPGYRWFVKFKGDAVLAERERTRFQAFVRSIGFDGAPGATHGN